MRKNTKLEILTPSGWCEFDGVNKVTHDVYVRIELDNGKLLCTSLDHKIATLEYGLVEAHFLVPGINLHNSQIIKVDIIENTIDLYDPVNVSNLDHMYIADNEHHHNCAFEGSSYTLIDGSKLAALPLETPIFTRENLEVFTPPMPATPYVITVDVSRGRHMDYSAFTVFDVSQMPYKVVATYKDNTVSTLELPHVIFNSARQYNNAYILVEVNDLGEEVANILWNEYEYENLYFTAQNKISQARGHPGIRTTSKVKGLGCSVLKELIEKDQLEVKSHRIIQELGGFVKYRRSYAAQDTQINDDLCTSLWLFAWLTKQPSFDQITNLSMRKVLTQKHNEYVDESLTPFGFYTENNPNMIGDTQSSAILPSEMDPYHLTEEQIELLK